MTNQRENAILGHILFDNKLYFEVSDRLKPDYFSDLQNRRILECVQDLAKQSRPFSGLEINDRYQKKFQGEESIAFRLTELDTFGYSIDGFKESIETLINDYKIDQIEKMAKRVINKSVKDPAKYVMDFMDGLLNSVAVSESMHIKDLAIQAANDMAEKIEAKARGEELKGIVYSGISALDADTGGFATGEVVVYAAATGMGKSTVARAFAKNMGTVHPCFMLTQEMTPQRITELIGISFTEINSHKLRTADLTPEEFTEYTSGLSEASKLDIEFDLITTLQNAEIAVRRWRMKTDKSKPAVLFVDYMQQMTAGKHRKYDNLNEVSQGLKQMAIRENILVIELAQLSRAVIQRGGDFRPMKTDINGSENISMDADIIMMGYRAEYYGFETDDDGNSTSGMLEIDIAKFRQGSPGVVKVYIDLPTGRIKSTPFVSPKFNNFESTGNAMPANVIDLPIGKVAQWMDGDSDEPPF